MMSNFVEGKISFSLPDGFKVEKLDAMKFYTEHFQSLQDAKAVDRVVFNPDKLELWLLEVTDYRVSTDRPTGWLDEIVQKVISSLACLIAMRVNSNLEDERILLRVLWNVPNYEWCFILNNPINPVRRLGKC
jgi:hypothetical protein